MTKVQQVNLNIEELKEFLKHIVDNNRFLQKTGKPPAAVEIQGESGIGKTSTALQLANELGLNFVKLNLAQIEELGDLIGFPVRQYQLCKPANTLPTNILPKQEPVKVGSSKKVKKKEKKMVKKMVDQLVTVMEEQEVDDVEVKIIKKQILENGKFVTKDIETKVPIKVKKEIPVEKVIPVEIDVEEEVEVEEELTAVHVEEPKAVTAIAMDSECVWVDEHAVEEYIKQGLTFTGQKRMSYCPPEWIADKQGGGFLILDDWNRA